MFLSEWGEFPSASCLAGKKKNLMTARVSMLLKSRASLTCFRACFFPGRAKDVSAPRYVTSVTVYDPRYFLLSIPATVLYEREILTSAGPSGRAV